MEGVFEEPKIGIIQTFGRAVKIAFIQNLTGQQFGIMYISAVLKEHNHEAEVFVEGLEANLIESLLKANPDVVGFTCITGGQRWVKKRAHEIKEVLNVPIIVGGSHPTYFPEMVEADNIDMICRGEGEYAVLELLNRLEEKKECNDILNLWVKKDGRIYKNELRPLVKDIDLLPFPDRGIYKKYPFLSQLTEMPANFSRGCPYNCTFCYNSSKKKLYNCDSGYVRTRSVAKAIIELQQALNDNKRIKSIMVVDDEIAFDKKWFAEFCREYKSKINLPFFASIRANFATEDNIRRFKEANCRCLSVGVETGNYLLRKKILGKNISNETYIEAAGIIKKYGIKLRTSNMFFIPGETIKDSFETLELNIRMKSDYPWAFMLQPFPRTDIYDYALENGYLDKDFSFDEVDSLGLTESPIKLRDGRKILVVHRLFYYGVKIPGFKFFLRALIYIPNNLLFDLLHRVVVVFIYISYHRLGILSVLKMAHDARTAQKRWGGKTGL